MADSRLLQLQVDASQLGGAALPEGDLLKWAALVPPLRRVLVVQDLSDLIDPARHDDCREEPS